MTMAERLQEGVAALRDPEAVRLAVSGWVRESLEDLSDPDTGAFVAERDGEVVGFVCVSVSDLISPERSTPTSGRVRRVEGG
jgi:hypothetical protein